MTSILRHADCFDVLPTLQDKSVDLVLADLPYGTTQCAWDTEIPLEKLWDQYDRICRGPVVLFAQTPFAQHRLSSMMLGFAAAIRAQGG